MPARRKEGDAAVAVFADRDGTLNREVNYLGDVRRLRLLPGVAEGICLLNRAGIEVVIATNQSGVARGYFGEGEVRDVNTALVRRLACRGAVVAAVYYCPHHPLVGRPPYRRRCRCRKPATGLLRKAARELGVDLRLSYSVGDLEADVLAGQRAGGKGVLVLTGHGRRTAAGAVARGRLHPDFVARDFASAARWIVRDVAATKKRGGNHEN